ncbi:MAG: MFS transporter [Roseibium sp.]|uniref:MFS transporter n=1 Tax=Roseibium sp. TaxID=1936156 RepID=UPI00260F5840|nr:MFS transporter [Roseibium sp.]MCV0427184.1 MFS transporter [Roseibium sp.]
MSNSIQSNSLSMIVPLVLFSSFMIMQANFLVLPSLAIYISEEFSLSNHDVSIVLASFSIAVCVSNFCWSRVLDRFNRKKILLVGGFLVSGVFLLTSLVSGIHSLILSRLLMAVVMPMMGASILPFVADMYEPKDRPRIMGYVMSAGYVVSLALIPLVILVSDHYSWRLVVIGLAAFTLVTFATAYLGLPTPADPQPKQAESGHGVKVFSPENRTTLLMLIRKFLQTASIFAIFTVYPTWLHSGSHGGSFSSSTMALIFFVSGVLGFLGSMVSGRLNDLLSRIATRVESLMSVSGLCAAFCILVPIFGKGLPIYQFLTYAPMIFFQSISVVLLMNSLIASAPVMARGYINAMSNIVFQAGIAVGSYVGFWIFEQFSITAVFVVAGVLLVSSAIEGSPKTEAVHEG